MKKLALCLVMLFVFAIGCKKEEETDPCKGINCLNGGACNNGTCVCPTGWTGEFCQTSTDSCANVNCLNGGVCNNGTCTCPVGWTGEFCQTAVDPCQNINCLNGGTCDNGTCDCPTGWTGQFCQTAVNACDTVTCLNGGTCVGGNCNCAPGYEGTRCQTLERAKFLGSYNVNKDCLTVDYSSQIEASSVDIRTIIIRDFGRFECSGDAPDVLATVTGNSLTIPFQTFCTGNEITLVGSGTISSFGTVITITYTTMAAGNSHNCTAVMTKL